jgi:hypothetical protein
MTEEELDALLLEQYEAVDEILAPIRDCPNDVPLVCQCHVLGYVAIVVPLSQAPDAIAIMESNGWPVVCGTGSGIVFRKAT